MITARIKPRPRLKVVVTRHSTGSGGDYQQGYDDGYETGKAEGKEIGFIEGHGVGMATGYNEGYSQGESAGQTAEYNRFWNSNQDGGNRRNYYYAYSYSSYNDDCFNPKYRIICEGGSTNGQNIFYNNTEITRIPVDIVVNGISARQMFYRCSDLKTIQKLVLKGVTDLSNMFLNCSALENIEIDGSIDVNLNMAQSSALSVDSVQSIIDHLADLKGQTAQKLTLHNTVGKALTAAQKTAITAKNWTLTY